MITALFLGGPLHCNECKLKECPDVFEVQGEAYQRHKCTIDGEPCDTFNGRVYYLAKGVTPYGPMKRRYLDDPGWRSSFHG